MMDANDLSFSVLRDQEGNSLTHQIYHAVKQDILFGRLEIGEKLNIVRLAQQYNVSRTPVKQALEMLKRDHLIEAAPGKQAVVKPPSVQEIASIYLLRAQLEPLVAKASLKYIPKSELLALKARLKELEANPEMHIDHIEFDKRLHSTLWRYLNSPMINSLFQVINDYSVRVQSFTIYSVSKPSTNNDEHMSIIDAALARDEEGVRKAVQVHLSRSYRRLLEFCSSNEPSE